jgi:hypothetical protein
MSAGRMIERIVREETGPMTLAADGVVVHDDRAS